MTNTISFHLRVESYLVTNTKVYIEKLLRLDFKNTHHEERSLNCVVMNVK